MALNKNVGIGGLQVGLVLVQNAADDKVEINTNEFGLKEATLRFATFAENNPDKEPARGMPCPDFVGGDEATDAILDSLDYLGAQTNKWIVNGEGDGIDILEVLCQGARFVGAGQNLLAGPVIAIAITNRGDGYTTLPSVVFTGGGVVVPAVAVARLERGPITLNAGGSGYVAGDILTLSGGTFDAPATVRVDAVDGSGAILSGGSGFHGIARGKYSAVPSNPVSVTGGTGSGATFDVTWRVGYIVITAGGSYTGTPVATLTGGTFATQATLGVVSMGARVPVPGGSGITVPFKPITTVKDVVQFAVYSGAAGAYQVRVYTNSLAAYTHGTYSGYDGIQANVGGRLIPMDGVTINVNDKILLDDGTAFAGVYKVINIGVDEAFIGDPNAEPWTMVRVTAFDESSEFNNTKFVNVAEGSVNAGRWQCTVTGSFTLNTDAVTFDKVAGDSELIPLYKVTIDYHAIELHFEYMAAEKVPNPRFLLTEYTRNNAGDIITDPTTGETLGLQIDAVTAIQSNIITDPVSGQVTVIDGPQVAISDEDWRGSVKYIGTAAQFSQTPAGNAWHVVETATIKIIPIPPVGAVVGE